MYCKNVRRAIALFMCIFIMGTLLTAKDASASACYNHDDKSVKVTQAATCGKNGYREYHCSKCGYLVRTETIKATGNHGWGSWTNIKAANCTEGGVRKHTCKTCGKTESETVSALGHNWGSWKVTKAVTCTTAGEREHTCSRCSRTIKETITAPGHNWGSWTTTKKPTCTATGTKQRTCSRCSKPDTQTIPAEGHNTAGSPRIVQPTCEKDGYVSAICSKCYCESGTPSVIKALGHNWGTWTVVKAATCTTAGLRQSTCTRCSKTTQETIAIPGHSYGSWTTVKSPTCTATGTQQRTCSRCSRTETQTISALGHNTSGKTVTVAETCEKDGYTSQTCSRCGIENGTKTVRKATGHNWGNWTMTKSATCTATGTRQRTCTKCSKPDTQTIAALGHDTLGTPVIIHETCEKDGYTSATCSKCHIETGTKSVIKAKHVWGDWKTTKEATCTATGTKQRTCSRCSKAETQTIVALGHNTLGTPKIVKPTCEKDGYTTAVCSRCYCESGTKTVNKALGHNWGNWSTTKSATCTTTGTKVRSCSRCQKNETQVIAALGHDTLGTPVIVHETCTKDGYVSATCSRCHIETGTKSVIKAKHVWGDWKKTKDATCTSTGTKQRTCSRCSKIETETIAALGHNTLGTPRIVKPTCERDGYTTAVCSRCYCESGTPSVIKALGHNWGDWNTRIQAKCKEAGSKERTCTRCDKVETQIIPAEGHNTLGTPRIVQPTCITDGYTTAVCSKCYCESGTKTILPATGKHHWEDWVEDQKPTCVEKGKKHRICNVCHKAEFGEINELGHNVQGYRNISATCEEDGYSGVVCSRCGQVMDGAKVYPATGHDWGNWIVDVEPKGDTIGARHRICKKCQKREDDNLWGGIDSYVIHFDGNGNLGGQMEDMKLKYDAWFIVPECDFDYGNGFDCWCTTKDGTGQCYKVGFSDQERGLVTDRSITNITLYAIWNECAVTYHDGISKAPLGKSVMEGHVFLPKGTYKYPSLKIDGLVLKGWSSEPGELIGGKVDYMMGAKNVNKLYTDLYPVYRFSEDNKWAVIYDPNGGTGGPGVKVYDKGKEDITVVGGEPSLTGYTFDGWEYPYKPIDRLYKDSWILPDWFENGNVRLIAKWKYNNRQLILDYGYDGKTDEITIDYDSYKLPDPDDRDGYIFRGWGLNKDTPVYSGGQAYNPDEGTTKLYAVWEPIKFIVEYYDCYTKKLLLREETDCSKNIRGNLCTIKGLNFDGWEETVYRRLPNGSSYNTVKTHKAGAPAVGLDFRSGVVKLYSKYSFIEHDGIWVIYHPNGGDTSPNYSAFSDTQAVKINDGSGMTKAGCKFVGWNSDKAFLSVNGSITTRTKNIMLIAEWKSTITFTLNYAEAPFPEFTAPNWVIPGQVIAVSDFGEPNWPGHYLQGWKDQKGTFYPIYSYYTIPSQNTVMTAVWGDYIYKIYYHNGFSGDLYDVPQDVGIEGTIDYTPPKEAGYKFEGWLTSLPSESPVGREPKYRNGEDRTFSKDLHLYSCFSEECTTSANTITVIYNNKGGEGGPGVVTYTRNANPSFEVSDLEPERKGYKFLGWSKSYYAMSVDFYPKDPCGGYDIPQDGPLTLYAVWGYDHTSDLKAEMQRRFGNVVMPDSYFDYETKLNTWHKVNDYCYFVLKTENEIDSNHVKYMTSTVMIIEFKNGKWSLESIGINQRVPEILSYYVTTHTNDLTGLLVTLGIDALEGIVALISPTAGIIMDVCTANEMIGELYRNYNKIPDFIEELTVSLCTEIVDVIRGNLLDSGVSIEDAEALIVSQYDWIRKECECSATDLANQIIELGGTGLDIVGFSTYLEPLWEKIGIKMSESVKEWKLPAIFEKEKIAFTQGHVVSLVITAIGMVLDFASWELNNTQLDVTGGNQNRALNAFREELLNQGFSQSVYDDFPTLLLKMYKLYYGITD